MGAIDLAGAVVERVAGEHPPGRCQRLVIGANINIALGVEDEVRARQGSVLALAHILDRDMRRDLAFKQPIEHFSGAVGDIAGDMVGRQAKAVLRPRNHRLGHVHLFGDARRRRFDIDDDGVLHVDQIVQAVGKHDFVASARGPRRSRIAR